MHGLIQGPDGRIYWTIGDRSYYVKTEGKTFAGEGKGATFRCWPDGTGFEVFHTGLRNPQELAFNDFGDLFTGDNNCDAGDKARLVQVVEGGRTGWDMNVQSLKSRGPWLREKMWETRGDKNDPAQPAYILPPLAHLGYGPSGIMHNPGTGMPEAYADCFLMANYPGEILAFNAVPEGSTYKLANNRRFLGAINPSDVTMGYDGRIYVAHWGSNWPINKDPAIYTLSFEDELAKPETKEVQTLFREGFAKLPVAKLAELLGHKDQRVRQEAHLTLAELASQTSGIGHVAKGGGISESISGQSENLDALEIIGVIARDGTKPLLARIHAIWAATYAARKSPVAMIPVMALLKDPDAEIRSQAARALGDPATPSALDALLVVAKDDTSPRVRFSACETLGKIGDAKAIPTLLEVLRENDDEDAYLRFAAAHGLALLNKPDALLAAVSASSPRAERLGVVFALRELKNPGVVRFITDPDAVVAAEAIRAIYDNRDTANFPALAALLDGQIPDKQRVDGVLRRVLAAAYRLGGEANAKRLLKFASDQAMPEALRLNSLDLLESWDLPNEAWRNDDNTKRLAQAQSKGINELEKESQPTPREPVWGWWWPTPARTPGDGLKVLRSGANAAAQAAAGKVKEKLLALDNRFGGPKTGPALLKLLADEAQPASYRAELLGSVDTAKKAEAVAAAQAGLAAKDSAVRAAARDLLVRADTAAGLPELNKALTSSDIAEAQAAVASLGKLSDPAAVKLLSSLFANIADGKLPEHLRVDAFLAAKGSPDATLKAAAEALDAALQAKTPEERFAMSLNGGSPERGRKVFLEHIGAQCQRCHKIGSEGASEAGPNLAGIALKFDRKFLLQSVVNPGAYVEKGFGTVVVTLKDGATVGGTLKDETADSIVIDTGAEKKTLRKSDIASQTTPLSGMPPMAYILNHAEVRDVVAYLATLK